MRSRHRAPTAPRASPCFERRSALWFSQMGRGRCNIRNCPPGKGEPVATPTLPKEVRCSDLDRFTEPAGDLLQTASGPVFVSVRPLVASATLNGSPIGQLVLVHDMSFIARRSRETREYLFLFFVGLGLMVALVTVIIAQLSWRGWIQGLRGLLVGEE